MLDKRLSICAEFVTDGGIVCDVGTDHAYLVAELLGSGKCRRAVAADIADGPLDAARKTLEKRNLSDKAAAVKSNGLTAINPDGITDVVIAGMGGELIADIVSKAEWLHNGINLVLQPMTRIEFLRKWLYQNAFEILCEKAVIDGNHAYTVMKVMYSDTALSDITLQLENIGKLSSNRTEDRIYAERLLARHQHIADSVGSVENASEHIKIIRMLNNFLRED